MKICSGLYTKVFESPRKTRGGEFTWKKVGYNFPAEKNNSQPPFLEVDFISFFARAPSANLC